MNTTLCIPTDALQLAKEKLDDAHGLIGNMIQTALYKKSLHLKDSDGSMQGYYGHLKEINDAIEAILALMAQAPQEGK